MRKYATSLLLISRYYEFDDDVYLVFLTDDDEGGDGFVCFYQPCGSHQGTNRREENQGRTNSFAYLPEPLVPACVNDQGNQDIDVQDAGHDVNEEGAVDGQENTIEAGIVRIEDEVPPIVAEKAIGFRKKRKAVGGASGSNIPPMKLRADHGSLEVIPS
ncbi:hypothetical protein Tco_1002256 [Tanacetum coccineum]|uniref:Uncharacterized protein n=1 Tax=Tanacetum coccineum TaxID=301880 RepID=A0ABQ5F5T3_9ASTR